MVERRGNAAEHEQTGYPRVVGLQWDAQRPAALATLATLRFFRPRLSRRRSGQVTAVARQRHGHGRAFRHDDDAREESRIVGVAQIGDGRRGVGQGASGFGDRQQEVGLCLLDAQTLAGGEHRLQLLAAAVQGRGPVVRSLGPKTHTRRDEGRHEEQQEDGIEAPRDGGEDTRAAHRQLDRQVMALYLPPEPPGPLSMRQDKSRQGKTPSQEIVERQEQG